MDTDEPPPPTVEPPGGFPPHVMNHIMQFGMPGARSPSAPSTQPAYDSRSETMSASPSGHSASDGASISSAGAGSDYQRTQARNKDGEKPKRRGPKPDSKPPLTRKQELNRQAQRTHRERKERYVKSLEEDVARLREAFAAITKEKTAILHENKRLKEILEAHGIQYDPNEDYAATARQFQQQTTPAPEVERLTKSYDEIGVEFVLALERPCMEHITFMATNNNKDPEAADFSGHALCLSHPPEKFNGPNPDAHWNVKMWDMQAADLSVLFGLSQRLQLDEEMTPIAVWATIARHERFHELSLEDFETVKQMLLPRVICYGFGAVFSEQDINDVMNQLFVTKFGY